MPPSPDCISEQVFLECIDPTTLYLHEVELARPLLTDSQIAEYITHIQVGNRAQAKYAHILLRNQSITAPYRDQLMSAMENKDQAIQVLVEGHLRLVIAIAKKYYRPGQELNDLIQEGNEALVKSVSTYDPNRGVPFSSYVGGQIGWKISKYVRTNRRVYHTGSTIEDNLYKVLHSVRQYVATHHQEPTINYLAESLSLTTETVNLILQSLNEPESLDAEDPETGLSLGDTLISPSNTLEEVCTSLMPTILNEIIQSLERPEHIQALILRYGLQNGLPCSQSEVAMKMGVNIKTARSWLAAAEAQLHRPDRARQLRPFLWES